jgi:hypothetical protein
MKLWRGQPDHDHWKRPFSSREKAWAYLGLAAVCAALSLASAFGEGSSCETGGRLLCTAVRSLALAFGASLRATEVAAWAGAAVALVLIGLNHWRKT